MRSAIPFLTLFCAAAASANPVSCTNGGLSRSVEVVYSDPGQAVPCEVIYNKSGEGSIETLWRANTEAGYCEARAAELIEKLEGLGWDCDQADAAPEGEPEAEAE